MRTVATTRAELDAFNLAYYIGPIVPWAMAVTGCVTIVGWLPSYWMESPNLPILAALRGSAAIGMFLLAWLCRRAAISGKVELTGIIRICHIILVSSLYCYLAYHKEAALLYSLPYCMVIACVSGFFWTNWWNLTVGTICSMIPPYLLVQTLYPGDVHMQAVYARLLLFTIGIVVAIYLLMNRMRKSYVQLLREADDQARLDVLTGLLNRSSWYDRVELLRERSAKRGEPSTLLYLDIDLFKSVNDRLGHVEGDRVLEQVGVILAESAQPDVQAARFGGEEFVVYMPSSRLAEAIADAERIRSSLRSIVAQSGAVTITVSIGIAELGQQESIDDALHRADAALLQAKSEGRDRVVIAIPALEPAASPRDHALMSEQTLLGPAPLPASV